MQSSHGSSRLLANKVVGGGQRKGSFLTGFRYNGEFCSTLLKVEHRIRNASLREQVAVGFNVDDSAAQPGGREEGFEVKLFQLPMR